VTPTRCPCRDSQAPTQPSAREAPAFEARICTRAQLASRVASLERPLVFTNGVFDILHRGHVTYLARARALGRSLVVALNTDESARRLGKGSDRPVNGLADRLAVIAALEATSLATSFEEDTPLELILAVRPDVLVKGGDWTPDTIVGAREVMSWGGTVRSIAFEHERSTTALLSRIRQS
jgi:rfaE bifunctional protein nucleotidyltransferase chain/domain